MASTSESVPEGPVKGRAAIRRLFEALVAEYGKPGSSFAMRQRHVEGDHAFERKG